MRSFPGYYVDVPAQAELALHKREAAAGRSLKQRGGAGADPRPVQSSNVDGSEAGLKAELQATSDKLATAQREAEELSSSLAKASSVIEVLSVVSCLQPRRCSKPPTCKASLRIEKHST